MYEKFSHNPKSFNLVHPQWAEKKDAGALRSGRPKKTKFYSSTIRCHLFLNATKMATSTPVIAITPESGLCVEVLINEYSVGTAVISRTVVLGLAGFCVELFPW